MNRALLPERAFEGLRGQGSEMRCLFLNKNLPGLSFGRPMDLHPDLFSRPLKGPTIGLIDIPKSPASQKVLTHYRYPSFHLPFMPGLSYFGRIGHKGIVSFQFCISPVQGWIIDIRFHHSCLQIVKDNGCRDTPKEFKGPNMTVNPALDILVEDKSDESVATVGGGRLKALPPPLISFLLVDSLTL